jgi:hypothetical protein
MLRPDPVGGGTVVEVEVSAVDALGVERRGGFDQSAGVLFARSAAHIRLDAINCPHVRRAADMASCGQRQPLKAATGEIVTQ